MDLKVRARKSDYVEGRREDFIYYLERSDLSATLLAESTGISLDWIKQVKNSRIQMPADYRMTILIDFIKDFERLQTYYAALER